MQPSALRVKVNRPGLHFIWKLVQFGTKPEPVLYLARTQWLDNNE